MKTVQRVVKDAGRSTLLTALLRTNGLDRMRPEYRFAPPRKWRFDYCWPAYKVALEVEGGVWTRGRHTRGAGFLKDIEKYNEAASLGWLVLRTTPDKLLTRDTIELLKRTIKQREFSAGSPIGSDK